MYIKKICIENEQRLKEKDIIFLNFFLFKILIKSRLEEETFYTSLNFLLQKFFMGKNFCKIKFVLQLTQKKILARGKKIFFLNKSI